MNTLLISAPRQGQSVCLEIPDNQADTTGFGGQTSLYRPRQAWQWMRQTLQPPLPSDWVRHEVAESWRRCLEEYRLRFQPKLSLPNPMPQFHNRAGEDFNPDLLGFFSNLEQQTRAFIGEAGLTFCLADAGCRLVGFHGRSLSDCPVGKLLAHPRADWSEPVIGNNGIGSAAVTQGPIAFSGEEHYLPLLHPFTTAGFPLSASNGELLAVLGLISDQRTDAGVLKSLACMLGNRLEEALLKRQSSMAPFVPGDGRPFPLRILRPVPPPSTQRDAEYPQLKTGLPPATTGDHSAGLACRLAEKAVRLQERRIPILVVGESGAGKEYLVRKAYEAGPRRNGPFIALNCASIPRDLIESELFGYAAGSFTGARKEGKAGKFLLADKGVLLLDEIGDMGLDLQAVLLRVLENSEFFPVGATEPVKVDVQIFAATNVPIQQAVREGRFRRDLYYRLNGAQLILPPLRDREDKRLIIQQLLEKELALSDRTGQIRISDAVMDLFLRHPWPGNIRQLSNVIRSSLHMAEGGEISIADLPDDFFEELHQGTTSVPPDVAVPLMSTGHAEEAAAPPAITLAEWELKGIKAALQSCKGNLTQTAKTLGITRGTLYKKLSQYGLSAR